MYRIARTNHYPTVNQEPSELKKRKKQALKMALASIGVICLSFALAFVGSLLRDKTSLTEENARLKAELAEHKPKPNEHHNTMVFERGTRYLTVSGFSGTIRWLSNPTPGRLERGLTTTLVDMKMHEISVVADKGVTRLEVPRNAAGCIVHGRGVHGAYEIMGSTK